MRVFALILICGTVLALPPLRAQETPAKPDTVEQVAEKVLGALEVEDEAALNSLAGRVRPDPWLVVDHLCLIGELGAAECFGEAHPHPEGERLIAYVAAQRASPTASSLRETLAAMEEAWQRADGEGVLRAGAPESEGTVSGSVSMIRCLEVRGRALEQLGRAGEATQTFRLAAEAARDLGWRQSASDLYYSAGKGATTEADWATALELFELRLPIVQALWDPEE